MFQRGFRRGAAGAAQGARRGLGAGRRRFRCRQAARGEPGLRRAADARRAAGVFGADGGVHDDAAAAGAASGDARAGLGRSAGDAQDLPAGRPGAVADDRCAGAGAGGAGRAWRCGLLSERVGASGRGDDAGREGAGEDRRAYRGGGAARSAVPAARSGAARQGAVGGADCCGGGFARGLRGLFDDATERRDRLGQDGGLSGGGRGMSAQGAAGFGAVARDRAEFGVSLAGRGAVRRAPRRVAFRGHAKRAAQAVEGLRCGRSAACRRCTVFAVLAVPRSGADRRR